MKCEKCFNHGFKFNVSSNHRNTCPLRNCECLKCQKVTQKRDNKSNGVTLTSEDPIAGPSGESFSKSMENCLKSEDNPLKAVQDLAQKLSKYEVSTEDLQTCVLYAVLKNNDFDINETKRQLCESRTAIAETLVSSYFGTERDSTHKRTRSPSPLNNQKIKSLKEFCPLKQTAKKSFPKNETKVPTDRTRSQKIQKEMPSNYLISKESNTQKGTTSPTVIMFSNPVSGSAPEKRYTNSLVMKNTPLGWKTITKTNVEKPVVKSLKAMKSIVGTTHILSQKPVQSVRPQILLNTNPIVSHSVQSKSCSISSYRPILPKTNSIDIPRKRADISSILLPQNVVIDVSTKQKSIPISIKNSDINQTMNSKSIKTSPVCEGWTPLAPKITKYSKIMLTKSGELNDSVVDPKQNRCQRLNAPIITTEAALAALSAFSDSNSSVDTMKVIQSQDVPQNEVFPLQHNFDDSVQMVKDRVRVITRNSVPITGPVARQSNGYKVLQKSLKKDFTQNCEQNSGEVIDFIQID